MSKENLLKGLFAVALVTAVLVGIVMMAEPFE